MICLGCLEDRKLKNDYCTKCTKELFKNKTPEPLDFDKNEFRRKRVELAERMSISGVQDKISMKFEGSKLVPTPTNGEYILKPVPANESISDNKEDIPANEHLSMQISKKIFKIRTAECGLIRFSDGELAYITKRFDYTEDGKKYDQEDFASVLGVTPQKDGPNYKYDAKTYMDCIRAIKAHIPANVINVVDFVKRIIFNYLISNGDAHLKNFSIYSLPDKNDFMLTPNYDVLNTRYHIKNENSDMAMELFSETTAVFDAVGFLTYRDFKKFSELAGINDAQFVRAIKAAFEIDKISNMVNNSFLSKEGKAYYIDSYIERLEKRLKYIPKNIGSSGDRTFNFKL